MIVLAPVFGIGMPVPSCGWGGPPISHIPPTLASWLLGGNPTPQYNMMTLHGNDAIMLSTLHGDSLVLGQNSKV